MHNFAPKGPFGSMKGKGGKWRGGEGIYFN